MSLCVHVSLFRCFFFLSSEALVWIIAFYSRHELNKQVENNWKRVFMEIDLFFDAFFTAKSSSSLQGNILFILQSVTSRFSFHSHHVNYVASLLFMSQKAPDEFGMNSLISSFLSRSWNFGCLLPNQSTPFPNKRY